MAQRRRGRKHGRLGAGAGGLGPVRVGAGPAQRRRARRSARLRAAPPAAPVRALRRRTAPNSHQVSHCHLQLMQCNAISVLPFWLDTLTNVARVTRFKYES